jgi:ubiquinone/menaquinone biosynthesis C-methylase UbiE
MSDKSQPGGQRICPASHAGFLATWLRRLVHNPEKILAGLIEEGQTAADLGCGPGFFTIPMARLVGERGRVIAVDLQQGMLDRVIAAARGAGVSERVVPHKCEADAIGVSEPVDFALAFYMVHEVPDVEQFLGEVAGMLKPGGRLLIVEPKIHVSAAKFAKTVEIALDVGLIAVSEPRVAFSRSVVVQRIATAG